MSRNRNQDTVLGIGFDDEPTRPGELVDAARGVWSPQQLATPDATWHGAEPGPFPDEPEPIAPAGESLRPGSRKSLRIAAAAALLFAVLVGAWANVGRGGAAAGVAVAAGQARPSARPTVPHPAANGGAEAEAGDAIFGVEEISSGWPRQEEFSPRNAADALSVGDHAAALAQYRGLLAVHPDDASYRAIVSILERKLARRCPTGQYGETCVEDK